jgi:hypothetical protein
MSTCATLSWFRMHKALPGLLSLGAALAVTACSGSSSAARRDAFMVCGKPLWGYQAEAPVTLTYATPGQFRLPIRPTDSWPVLLRLTDDCASGVRISLDHPEVLMIHARARARDGLIAGISILAKRRGRTTLTATTPAGATTRIEIGSQ